MAKKTRDHDKRRRQHHRRQEQARNAATPHITDPSRSGLYVPIPFSQEDWSGQRLGDIHRFRPFAEYWTSLQRDLHQSGRSQGYLKLIIALAHPGRFPEDISNGGDFVAEAENMRMTPDALNRILDRMPLAASPSAGLPTPGAAFEMLVTAAGFARMAAEQLGVITGFAEQIGELDALAIAALSIAINIEFGLQDAEGWRVPPDK